MAASFTPKTLAFLRALKRNNDRDWFKERKEQYEREITLRQADTIDDNFGFSFHAFPDPFNAPFVRTSADIPASTAEGNNLNATALVALTNMQTLRVKYIRRRTDNIGFPDFAQPSFFQKVTLPYSDLDRFSARYEARALTPWFTNLKVSGYYQDQDRLLRNQLPVQFPAPTAVAFLPLEASSNARPSARLLERRQGSLPFAVPPSPERQP